MADSNSDPNVNTGDAILQPAAPENAANSMVTPKNQVVLEPQTPNVSQADTASLAQPAAPIASVNGDAVATQPDVAPQAPDVVTPDTQAITANTEVSQPSQSDTPTSGSKVGLIIGMLVVLGLLVGVYVALRML